MISREELESVAELARLTLSEAEAVGLQKDISNILEYVGHISGREVPASLQDDRGRSPGTSLPSNTPRNVMRDDTPRKAGDPLAGKEQNIIAAFPRQEKDYLVVRKVIQKEE